MGTFSAGPGSPAGSSVAGFPATSGAVPFAVFVPLVVFAAALSFGINKAIADPTSEMTPPRT